MTYMHASIHAYVHAHIHAYKQTNKNLSEYCLVLSLYIIYSDSYSQVLSVSDQVLHNLSAYQFWLASGVLASEGWWEAWQTFPKVTRSQWSKTKLEDPPG